MKHSLLAAAAVAALAAGTVGGTAPAFAGSQAHKHGTTSHGHADHGTHQLRNAQRKVSHDVRRKDAALGRTLAFHGLSKLSADDAALVTADVAADRAALAALGEQVAATTTLEEVRALAAEVRRVRPEIYRLAVNETRHADRVGARALDAQAVVADLQAQLDALEAAGVDVTDLRTALDAIAVVLQGVVDAATAAGDQAVALTAVSTHADVRDVLAQVTAASGGLAGVGPQLDTVTEAVAALSAPAPTDPVTP